MYLPAQLMPENIHHTINNYNDLVRGIKEGNTQVLEKIYRENYFKIEKYILKNSGSISHAEDIYQEAFTIFWRNVQEEKFLPQGDSSAGAYLYKIASYKWLDYLRSAHFRKTEGMDEYVSAAADEYIDDEERHARLTVIKQKFQELGDSCRELLSQFYYKKRSMREIAADRSWTEATARNNKYRCIEKLRKLICQ